MFDRDQLLDRAVKAIDQGDWKTFKAITKVIEDMDEQSNDKINLVWFEIFDVEGALYSRHTIETSNTKFENRERLRVCNPEDVELLRAIEKYIRIKRGM